MDDERPSLLPPLVAILTAVVGTSLMVWSFARVVDLALGGGGTIGFQILFFAGAALDIVALVLAIVGLVRGRRRGLSGLALAFGLVPVILVILLAIVSNAAVESRG